MLKKVTQFLKPSIILIEGFFIIILTISNLQASNNPRYWIFLNNNETLDNYKKTIDIKYYSKWFNAFTSDTILPNHKYKEIAKFKKLPTILKHTILYKKNSYDSPYSQYYMNSIESNFKFINILPLLNYFNLSSLARIKIGVADGGFDTNSTFFKNINIIKLLNYTDEITTPQIAQHGTAILSLLGGHKDKTIKTAGEYCDFYLIKTEVDKYESTIEEYNLIHAIEYFVDTANVDVISISLGYRDFDNSNDNLNIDEMSGDSTLVAKALNIAYDKGVLSLVAAGNEGLNSDWPYITSPADAKSTITVGNIDDNGKISPTSSIGIDKYNIKPDIVAKGENILAYNNIIDAFSSFSGTSLATPIAANIVILAKRLHPNWSNYTIKEKLIKSSSKYNTPDYVYGYGVPNSIELVNDSLNLLGFIFNSDSTPLNKVSLLYKNNELATTKEDGFFYINRNLNNQIISIEKLGYKVSNIEVNSDSIYKIFITPMSNFKKHYITFNSDIFLGNYKITLPNNDSTYTNYDGSFYLPDTSKSITISKYGITKKISITDSIIKLDEFNYTKTLYFINNENEIMPLFSISTSLGDFQTNSNGAITISSQEKNSFFIYPIQKNVSFNKSSFTLDNSIDTVFVYDKITLFPNPVTDENLYIGCSIYDNISIFSISGKHIELPKIYDIKFNAYKIDISKLSSGIYFAIVNNLRIKFLVLK